MSGKSPSLAEVAKKKAGEEMDLADRYIAENNLLALRGLLEKALKDRELAFQAMEMMCGGREIPAKAYQVEAIKEVALAAIQLAKLNIEARKP